MNRFDVKRVFPRYSELRGDLEMVVKAVPLSSLLPPDPPLRPLREGHVEALKESIASVGLLQPLLVTAKGDGGYLILDGHHRYQAVLALKAEGRYPHSSVNVMVVHAPNPNAYYGLWVAAYQANRYHQGVDLPGWQEVEVLMEASFGGAGIEGLRRIVALLASLDQDLRQSLLDLILETNPLERLPEREGIPSSLIFDLQKEPPEARAGIYLLEAVAEGDLPGFILHLARLEPRGKGEGVPKPRKGEVQGFFLPLEPPPKGVREVKRFLRTAGKALSRGLRGVRLRQKDLERQEVVELLEHLRAALLLLSRLLPEPSSQEGGRRPQEEVHTPLHPEVVERLWERAQEEGLEIPDA